MGETFLFTEKYSRTFRNLASRNGSIFHLILLCSSYILAFDVWEVVRIWGRWFTAGQWAGWMLVRWGFMGFFVRPILHLSVSPRCMPVTPEHSPHYCYTFSKFSLKKHIFFLYISAENLSFLSELNKTPPSVIFSIVLPSSSFFLRCLSQWLSSRFPRLESCPSNS